MTDNELKKWNKEAEDRIIKALECCVDWCGEISCWDCPLKHTGCIHFNKLKETLDIINRQKAKIEALQMDNQQLQSDIANANMNADHALAEIDRLCMEIDELIIAKDLLFDEAEALIKKAKAEAVKEFAERLKAKSNKTELVCSGTLVRTEYTITKETLDNLVKEMVGDGNG